MAQVQADFLALSMHRAPSKVSSQHAEPGPSPSIRAAHTYRGPPLLHYGVQMAERAEMTQDRVWGFTNTGNKVPNRQSGRKNG